MRWVSPLVSLPFLANNQESPIRAQPVTCTEKPRPQHHSWIKFLLSQYFTVGIKFQHVNLGDPLSQTQMVATPDEPNPDGALVFRIHTQKLNY